VTDDLIGQLRLSRLSGRNRRRSEGGQEGYHEETNVYASLGHEKAVS